MLYTIKGRSLEEELKHQLLKKQKQKKTMNKCRVFSQKLNVSHENRVLLGGNTWGHITGTDSVTTCSLIINYAA